MPAVVAAHVGQTVILLPLKPGKRARVEAELRQIAPETILFLSKLERLTVHFAADDVLTVERDVAEAPLVRLQSGDLTRRFG